jgi:hypothetical protein
LQGENVIGRETVKDARSGHSRSRLRRVEVWLVIPIAIVIGLIAFTGVGASAPQTPAQAVPTSLSGASGLGATNHGGPAAVYHAPSSDPRFDAGNAPAGTQYCAHTNHSPPCGNKPRGGFGAGNGPQRPDSAGTGATSAHSETAASPSTTTGGLPFTGEDVLLVMLAGLLLTAGGLELAARTRVRPARTT